MGTEKKIWGETVERNHVAVGDVAGTATAVCGHP